MLSEKIQANIRDIPNFPTEGILFKDLTPILKSPSLCLEIVDGACSQLKSLQPDALVCMESRGFWFGLLIATKMGIPMIPVRKEGKLPFKTVSESYKLEYGHSKIEMHVDAIQPGWQVVIHDDLLATGGTAEAAAKLVRKQGAAIAGFSFIVELSFLGGRKVLEAYSSQVIALTQY